jgi:rubrerythrin
VAGEKELRTIIEGFLEEEESAGEQYVDLANALKYFGYISESEKIFDIAINEGQHREILKRVLKKLK